MYYPCTTLLNKVTYNMNEVKYKKIALELEKNIKNNIYSKKLPPVRSLLTEFNVANPTMNKALKILMQKGLIIPSGPRGNIISKKNIIRAKTNIVSIFCGANSPDFQNDPLLKELKFKIEADGYKPLFMNVPDPNVFDDENFWSSNWVDGYIFAYSTIKKELAYKLHNKSVPFVVANRLPSECGGHWVEFNLKKTLHTLVKASIEAGRKQIMLAYSGINLPSYVAYIKQIWNEILKEYSRECSGDLIYFSGNDSQQNSLECASKFAESPANSLILIGISPSIVESELAAMGRQNNEDYSLAYRSHQVDASVENSSYVLMPYKTLAVETWNLFKRVIEEPEIEAQNILIDEDIYINKITVIP